MYFVAAAITSPNLHGGHLKKNGKKRNCRGICGRNMMSLRSTDHQPKSKSSYIRGYCKCFIICILKYIGYRLFFACPSFSHTNSISHLR